MSDEHAPAAGLPRHLADGYRKWHAEGFARLRERFTHLAAEGQRPPVMIITCCDSRIDPVAVFDAGPGELFVVRNVANLVPPHHPDHNHHGTSAAVEFAVTGLRVRHIVVLGHSGCGGIAACDAMCRGGEAALARGESYISRWMSILEPAYGRVADIADDTARQRALEREGVRASLANLKSFPFVRTALERGELELHGAWIDIASGGLHVLDLGGSFAALAPDT